MRDARLLLALLLAGMIAAGPAAHIHSHPFAASHGSSARTAVHCSFCASGAGQAVVAVHSALAVPMGIPGELHSCGALAGTQHICSPAISRAPPAA